MIDLLASAQPKPALARFEMLALRGPVPWRVPTGHELEAAPNLQGDQIKKAIDIDNVWSKVDTKWLSF